MTPEETVALKAELYDLVMTRAKMIEDAQKTVEPLNKAILEMNAKIDLLTSRLKDEPKKS